MRARKLDSGGEMLERCEASLEGLAGGLGGSGFSSVRGFPGGGILLEIGTPTGVKFGGSFAVYTGDMSAPCATHWWNKLTPWE